MEALRRSLDAVSADKKKPVKAALAKTASAKTKGKKTVESRKAATG
jgi:hypothetical protein